MIHSMLEAPEDAFNLIKWLLRAVTILGRLHDWRSGS